MTAAATLTAKSPVPVRYAVLAMKKIWISATDSDDQASPVRC
jgi:hypothetical protein